MANQVHTILKTNELPAGWHNGKSFETEQAALAQAEKEVATDVYLYGSRVLPIWYLWVPVLEETT
jgi:hypothetical protein